MHAPCRLELERDTITIEFTSPDLGFPGHALFAAFDSQPIDGSARVPFGKGLEGSSVFLPFRANVLLKAQIEGSEVRVTGRTWSRLRWSDPLERANGIRAIASADKITLEIPLSALDLPLLPTLKLAVWAKDLRPNDGWGEMIADPQSGVSAGRNDRVLHRYFNIDWAAKTARLTRRGEHGSGRVRIYQLLPRLFSNINEKRLPNGTIEQNGVGKFDEITAGALSEIKAMGFTHIWLTGVLAQITATDYKAIGLPADDPDLLKGLAGSPYAIRDYFDVCPDYARDPAERLEEFRDLLQRICSAGLRTLIDFVPNHVGRCYASSVRPDLSFGRSDDPTRFFAPQNNYFWLQADSPGGGPPLRLPTVDDTGAFISPTCLALRTGDGLFESERKAGRVTGNNAVTWRPGVHDWYETVKLNYGFDFTTGAREYPHSGNPDTPVPNTWLKMDAVLAYWQSFRVDGFRCDMAHMVPPEFWCWALDRARLRDPGVLFVAEAYDNDPMKVGQGNVILDLLNAGFDAVYDDPTYKTLKGIYESGKWANDIDAALNPAEREMIFSYSLRYAENHDEVRLAGRDQWQNIGADVGRPVSAILYGAARGPALLYSGQEVGEPASGAEGFGGDDARTTIFDYWSMPELAKWVNQHRYDGGGLTDAQRRLRAFYTRLVRITGEAAFRDGIFYGLNHANRDEPQFGRLVDEGSSGHWLYSYLRADVLTGQCYLVAVNLHPSQSLHDVRIRLPDAALAMAGIPPEAAITLIERLSTEGKLQIRVTCPREGPLIPDIPKLTPFYFEFQIAGS